MLTLEATQNGKKVSSMSFTERTSKEGREITAREMKEWEEKTKKEFDNVEFALYFD